MALITAEAFIASSASADYKVVAFTGNPAPQTENGTTFFQLSHPSLSNSGDISFQASLAGPGINLTNDATVYLAGPGGYQRNVMWKNTNRLLAIEGYDGVKTGTTDAAGACLIARGQRGSDALIVVILGSATSDARYVVARNLFRWAFWVRAAAQ